ncbi:helix-turn-helix transcriptional regulator [Agromyces luteolus]|uniref:DNA-binding response regulator n=1 Tax=Agromyces luteolus TaxID=88373 RepID=A0A7C9HL57_9MICO|nr:helix-turn-helix transcriptional regulator [Agromyces luteolus]MUN07302.1 DNA-binding response regulator [Agromyces luteolus]GLK28558.1 helix-turn-helix transcriptional regulator [Agromyces luteolus]
MVASTSLEQARTAYAERRWSDAVEWFGRAEDGADAMSGDDLDRYAMACNLVGHGERAIEIGTLAHEAHLAAGRPDRAAYIATWISLESMDSGNPSQGMGWLARATRLVERLDEPGAVAGFVLIPEALGALYAGDAGRALELFGRAGEIAERTGDPDVAALALLGSGQAVIMAGDPARGIRMLDEVMVSVTAGEVGPVPSGIVYCAVIGYCHLTFELARAVEWTRALDRWCRDQPSLVAFSGQCHAHRAELFRLHGAWTDAMAAARLAEDRLLAGDFGAAFGAHYQQAEVLRLRGEVDEAEARYAKAAESGWDPQPGLALLRLDEGRVELAQSLIRRSAESADAATRCHLLPAIVSIEVAAGDLDAARAGADELAAMHVVNASVMLRAITAYADGEVRLAAGDASGAFARLRAAREAWVEVGAPYEVARCRVLMARARRDLDEDEAAELEEDLAEAAFAELGAEPALAALLRERGAGRYGDRPLTGREVEVLRLVTRGITNREIASELHLSEKTVARHLSNIFAKLDVPSRAAATAYAFEHRLV